MPAGLLLAAILLQHPYGEPPREVLRAAPAPESVAGEWRMLGPLHARSGGGEALSAKQLAAMRAGAPWPGRDEPFEIGGRRLLWRDAELGAAADAAAAEFIHPRRREGFETGRLEFARLPLLSAEDGPRTALFYRAIHARARGVVRARLLGRGGWKLWINGEPVADSDAGAAAAATIALEPGLNHFLLECTAPPSGPWWFELRHRHALVQADINRAIDSGMQHLLSRQQPDGAWPAFSGYQSGTTALALFALMKSGLPRDHPAARRALLSLRRLPPDRTYSTSLAILAICAFGDPAHDDWLRELAGDLVEWQQGDGLWAYPDGGGDLSNTQFAALALHAAALRGIDVPRDTWRELESATMACRGDPERGATGRSRPAGFGYAVGGLGSTASMTAAGVGTLLICAEHLGEGFEPRSRAAVDSGLAWLGGSCPLHAALPDLPDWSYYTLYGLERAGALARTERFGEHPWYAEGAAQLLEDQLANGSWSGDDVATSFALLFLTRATSKAAVTQPGGGDGAGRLFASSPDDGPLRLRAALKDSLDLWVDSGSRDFARYARVVYWVRPPDGDWMQVPGGATKRHDARVALDRPGVWQARASAFLHDGSTLGSGTLEIALETAAGRTQAADWDDPEENLLGGGACAAVASSGAAAEACDASFTTRWTCAEGDATPWLELRLGRRVQGRTVVLRPALWQPDDAEQQPEPARVRVCVNGEEAGVVADLPSGWPARWRVDLGAVREIRSLRIEILGVRRGALGACSVGFCEVEVHRSGPDGE